VNIPFTHLALPTLASEGVTTGTRQAHMAMLTLMQDIIQHHALGHYPLDEAIVEALEIARQTRPWRYTTLESALGTLQGAWKRMNMYTLASPRLAFYQLASSPWILDARRAISRLAAAEERTQAFVITADHVRQTLHSVRSDSAIHAFTAIAWWTCGRCGDVQKLEKRNVTLSSAGRLTVQWTSGKGVTATGAGYCIVSHIPPHTEIFKSLSAFLLSAPAGPLFPATTKWGADQWGIRVRNALRQAAPQACQRSFRKGAIIAMMSNPDVSEDTVRQFSGHTTLKSLRIYTSFGKVNEKIHHETIAASRHLLGAEEMEGSLAESDLEELLAA